MEGGRDISGSGEGLPRPFLAFRLWLAVLLLMALVLGVHPVAWAQRLGSPMVSNYEPEQYNGHAQVWAATQDSRGIMYFACSTGVLEFDGQRWRNIRVPGDAITRGLALAKDGTLYYGSVGDFGYLALDEKGGIKAVSLRERIPEAYRTFNDVWQVLPTAQGVYIMNRSRIFRAQGGRVYVVSGRMANCHACILNETVFYMDQAKGLCGIRGDEALSVPIPGPKEVHLRVNLTRMGTHGLLWLDAKGRMDNYDLSSYWNDEHKRYEWEKGPQILKGKPFSDAIKKLQSQSDNYLIRNIRTLRDHSLAIGTFRHGVLLMDPQGHLIRRYNTTDGLVDNTVFDTFMDRSKNLWVATNHGISHIEINSPVSIIGAKNGLKGTIISAIEHKSNLYLGGFQDTYTLHPYDATKEDCQSLINLTNPSFDSWEFKEVGDSLMSASGQAGLMEIRHGRGILIDKRYSGAYCLIQPSRYKDHLLLGTSMGVIAYKKQPAPKRKLKENESLWQAQGKVEGLDDVVRNFAEDAHGNIWASTNVTGLLRLRFLDKQLSAATFERCGPQNGLPSYENMRIFAHGKWVYAITPQGIYQYEATPGDNRNKIRFTPEETFGKPLLANNVNARHLFFQDPNTVWVSSGMGIYKATGLLSGNVVFDDKLLKGIAAPDERFFVTHDGLLILPGKPTLVVDATRKRRVIQPYKTLIRAVISQEGEVFKGTDALLERTKEGDRTLFSDSQTRECVLNFPQSSLTFEFAAPFFERPGTMEFQYLLEGAEKNWSDWTRETRKEYTFLHEGNYVFHVKSRNINGVEGEEATYVFSIKPPWYRTWPAYVLWVLLGWVLIYILFKYLTYRLVRQKEVLERRVARRTEQLKIAKEEAEKAQEKAEKASDFKSAFIANTSHELRTPLNAILGFMRILNGSEVPERERNQFHGIVLNASENLLQIVEDLLDLAKIEAGRLDVVYAPFSLRAVVENCLGILGNRAKEKQILLRATVAQAVPPALQGDAHRIQQMMINLVGNAIKFTHKGQVHVRVSADPQQGEWQITVAVEDTGLGVSPEILPRLFTAFTQADSDAKRMGTGLGLSITKQLAELMGGTVGATSELGKGSCFWFTFRAQVAEEREKAPGALDTVKDAFSQGVRSNSPAKIRARVLFADDNPSNRLLMEAMLTQIGADFVTVEDGQDALVLFGKEHFDVVVLDGRMPRMGGLETLQHLRRTPKGQDVPILLCSASSSRYSIENAKNQGFDGILKKPTDVSDLSKVLGSFGFAMNPDEPLSEVSDSKGAAIPSGLPLVDGHRLDMLWQALGGQEGFLDFVETIIQDSPRRLDAIAHFVAQEDREQLTAQAHDLKSNTASVGLLQFAALAARLEEEGAVEPISVMLEQVTALQALWLSSLSALQDWIRSRS